ncbi:hypothetical protein JIQ42_04180 [Leishmania sp. Namibia]|uniref:hypothetical protein n=1 Tax=Leishmania sp. Namibia TaxID=2802991 RepID=UPI001B655FBF|nr:hypothetical protein JIQ42_04180 [Leishmania sp. Namibia]
MTSGTLQVKLSQDSLFFPLPFTNATIDNVVQVKNTLPVVQGDPKANVISFKILSRVQYRYSVRPPVGFIGAGEYVTIVFSFNPEHVKMSKNPEERELPTEATKDAIHVDFAVVDAQLVPTALAHWVPGSKDAKMSREIMADASQFWKKVGQVKKNSPTMMRYKLKCVFATRNNVPDSLVMCMKEEDNKAKATADDGAPLPRARPPMTSSTQPQSPVPPEAPPHRHSESQRTTPTASTPYNDAVYSPCSAGASGISPRPSAASAAPASSALSPSSAPAQRWSASAGSTDSAVTLNDIAEQVMHYKLSYQMAGVLLCLTLLCGLFDQSNLLTWLIAQS